MNRISLASGVLPEFGPVATIGAAAHAGFDSVGLWVDPETWTDATGRDCAARLADSALELLDVEVIWLGEGAMHPAHLRVADVGLALGARNLLVVSSDPDAGSTAAKLAQLCEHVGTGAMRVVLEFGLFTRVRTIAQALAILNVVDSPVAGLLIDPLHLARSGGTPADVAQVERRLLPYAQFCDAPAVGAPTDDVDAIVAEALDGRRQLGEGDLPLISLLRALPANVPLSIELRSQALREGYPDANARAVATARATRAFLERATAPA